MVTAAGGEATPPTVTTTDCEPVGALAGTTKLICEAPSRPDATPANKIGAGTPPTVTATGSRGCGSKLIGVAAKGDAPVASAGETEPSPVTNARRMSPRRAVEKGTREPK